MPRIISEEVDIFKLPATMAFKGSENQITIGDLHGNAMKLMFLLVAHQIATITEEDYLALVKIYKTPEEQLTAQYLEEFNEILGRITFNPGINITLIGDELADRGSNDYFTLKILQKLKREGVPVEIIFSNHSMDFIECYEIYQHFDAKKRHLDYSVMLELDADDKKVSKERKTWPGLGEYQARSMQNLQLLVDNNFVSMEEIKTIIQDVYKPSLRAISYSLNEDKTEITIFSHAGIGLTIIKDLAKKLAVEYKDTTVEDLAQTIEDINKRFLIHLINNTIHTLYDPDKLDTAGEPYPDDVPFERIAWNRHYKDLDRPDDHSGYKVCFVHGHDSYDPKKAHIYNLDTALGRVVMRF